MAREKIKLEDYGLLFEPNVSKALDQLSIKNEPCFTAICTAVFHWAASGYPENFGAFMPKELSLMEQSFIERIMSAHISRWHSYNSHRREKP